MRCGTLSHFVKARLPFLSKKKPPSDSQAPGNRPEDTAGGGTCPCGRLSSLEPHVRPLVYSTDAGVVTNQGS